MEVLAEAVQAATGEQVELAFVDDGYTGRTAADAAAAHGIALEVVKLSEAKSGFVLLPRRWVVEHSFAWLARFHRLARDYERLPETVRGLHFIAFACLMVQPRGTATSWTPINRRPIFGGRSPPSLEERTQTTVSSSGNDGGRSRGSVISCRERLRLVRHSNQIIIGKSGCDGGADAAMRQWSGWKADADIRVDC